MKILKPKEVSERLNVTVWTLQEWDRKGKLKAYRNPKTNRRYYTEEQIDIFLGLKKQTKNTKTAIYCRVSNQGKKDDMANQKKNQDVKMYFVKNDAKTIIKCERHKIQIPTLGFVQLKEYGYIPTDMIIKSGTESEKAGKFYAIVLMDENPLKESVSLNDKGLGVDLGITKLTIDSNGNIK